MVVTQFAHGAKKPKTGKEIPGRGSDGYPKSTSTWSTPSATARSSTTAGTAPPAAFTAVLGRMATYSGQEVNWDDAVAKGPDEMPKKFAFDADPPAMPDKDGNYPHVRPRHLQTVLTPSGSEVGKRRKEGNAE